MERAEEAGPLAVEQQACKAQHRRRAAQSARLAALRLNVKIRSPEFGEKTTALKVRLHLISSLRHPDVYLNHLVGKAILLISFSPSFPFFPIGYR